MAKPQFKNSSINLKETLEAGRTYTASAWMQTRDAMNMSEEDYKRVQYIQNKLLEFGLNISVAFQEKTDGYPKKGGLNLFTEDPNRQVGSFSKPKVEVDF